MSEEATDTKAIEGSEGLERPNSGASEKGKPRKKLGRKGRRKRKRLAEIEAALAAQTSKATSTSASVVIPKDRDYQWPAVRELCNLDDDDKRVPRSA